MRDAARRSTAAASSGSAAEQTRLGHLGRPDQTQRPLPLSQTQQTQLRSVSRVRAGSPVPPTAATHKKRARPAATARKSTTAGEPAIPDT